MAHCIKCTRDACHPRDPLWHVSCRSLLTKLEFPDMKFTNYFMGYQDPASVPDDAKDRVGR